ncbi:MAG TPA: VOC family protein [Candidatus Angelobacter sp.]|nr:VOC family protein [Candidatus Angelobacter sp.]
MPTDLDHILLGINDLDHGIFWVEERSGVRAVFGGVHPGRGTRNALLSLGPRQYLEIIALDPQQAGSAASREPWAARLNALKEPRIINWAAHTDDLAAVAQKAAAAGISAENPREGSRARPDGKILRWKSFGLKEDFDGVLPFFIEWSADSIHPSQDAPAGCTLEHFSIESPSVKDVREVAGKLGLNVEVKSGKKPLLHARIAGKKGAFELTCSSILKSFARSKFHHG